VHKQKTVAVVIPAYNEEQLIKDTILSVPDFVDRIFVVNDASTDSTQKIIGEISRGNPRIMPIVHEKNSGVGAAIISGYKQSLLETIDITVVMAGDNQMDPKVMPQLIDPIINNKADYSKKPTPESGISKRDEFLAFFWKYTPHVSDEVFFRLLETDGSAEWLYSNITSGTRAIKSGFNLSAIWLLQ